MSCPFRRVGGEREEGGENAAHDALCLGNKFMKLAHKILEDEPYVSPPHASINIQYSTS